MADASKLKTFIDTYGVAVRAGLITPQVADEQYFRRVMDLPEMSADAIEDWAKTDNIRKPITLAKSEETVEVDGVDDVDDEESETAQIDKE